MHRLERSFQNINSIDFFMINSSDAVAKGIIFNKFPKNTPVFCRNLF